MRNEKLRLLRLLLLVSLLTLHAPLSAQTRRASTEVKATKFEIRDPEGVRGGKLYLTVGGRERRIFNEAFAAWLINDGQQVVYSSYDGSGGFENEGQSLRIYDVKTGRTRKILSEYTFVVAVQEVRTGDGAIALLVKLGDGGLGGSYFAVVDPKRGEVFYRRLAEATALNGDQVTIASYRADDWDTINDARRPGADSPNQVISTTNVAPDKTEKHDLKALLKRPVIYNPRPDESRLPPLPKAKEVKIYFWDPNGKTSDISLVPVMRKVGGGTPLRLALDLLFYGPAREDEAKGLSSSTFGMRFEGVTLTKGTALVKFSQPPNQTNYGSLGPMIFADAIDKTARQFPTVKRVEICAVGETLLDSQLEKPFPRCTQ